MSKEIKSTCEKLIRKMQTKLEELYVSAKNRKSQTVLQKMIIQIINDFKFFCDQFSVISLHFNQIQKKLQQKDQLIFKHQQDLFNRTAEKKMIEQMMKSKLEKVNKESKFLQFAGKTENNHIKGHARCQSELIKKGLNEIEKQMINNSRRVVTKVRQLKGQIQNKEQGYLTTRQNHQNDNNDSKKIISHKLLEQLDLSHIMASNIYSPPSKQSSKHTKLKQKQIEDIASFKTKKKQLKSLFSQRINLQSQRKLSSQAQRPSQQRKISEFADSQLDPPPTVQKVPINVINKKKKQELAELIKQQTQVVMRKGKYFETDF